MHTILKSVQTNMLIINDVSICNQEKEKKGRVSAQARIPFLPGT